MINDSSKLVFLVNKRNETIQNKSHKKNRTKIQSSFRQLTFTIENLQASEQKEND